MDLGHLVAEQDIIRQLSRFARILDGKRWGDLGDVFADDLTFDYGAGGDQNGIEALRATVSQFLDACGPTQHLIGSVIVTVTGATATSLAYVQARHQRQEDALGGVLDSCGDYRDDWERRANGWRIVRRDVTWMLHSGDPAILTTSNRNFS